jgi:hypothetical protein
MRRILRIALLGAVVCALAVGGSAVASANGHHRHAKLADVVGDVKDANTDSRDAAKDKASAQQDVNTPDSPAVVQQEQADAQNEQADNQGENQEGQQEGDNPAQAAACKGLLTDNVQYDDQTGTCTAETGQDNGADNQGGGQDNNQTGGQDNGHNG